MANPYETRRYLDEYLLFHYAKQRDLCPFPFISRDLLRFHERIREECLLPPSRAPQGRTSALDVGCAVGRFTFELSRVADDVLGIDNSRSFINAAREMARRRRADIRMLESGKTFLKRRVALPRNVRAEKVGFDVGDAMDLSRFTAAGPYDIVAAINLLCRLPSPQRFLRQLPELVAPGGQLILASPFSWLEQYTSRGQWLSPEALKRKLRPHFRLARKRDLPFLIREHRRKYQLVISHIMTFVRV